MTTEQAADRLGVLAVTWPKMPPAMQRQVYDQLRADEQEAVRVLFSYDDGQEHTPPPAQITAAPEVLDALQRVAAAAGKRKAKPAAQTTAPAPTPPPAATSATVTSYLNQLADLLEQQKAAAPAPPRPAAPRPAPRPKLHCAAMLEDMKRELQAPPPAPRPIPQASPRPAAPRVDYRAEVATYHTEQPRLFVQEDQIARQQMLCELAAWAKTAGMALLVVALVACIVCTVLFSGS